MENDDIFVLSGGGRNLTKVKKRDLERYSIPISVTSIGKRAFKGCSLLHKINIPGNVKNIGADAFMDCKSLFAVKISEGVMTIGKGAFRNCSSLKEIVLPKSLREISAEAFIDCPSIRRIKIQEGVTKIGKFCFANCKSLEIVVIPNSIMTLGDSCFKGCGNLKEVFLRSQTPNSLIIENALFDYNNHADRILYAPSNIVNDYKKGPLNKYFKHIESEEKPELTDWNFSELRYDYIPKKQIEDAGIPGFIILKLAGNPDLPSIDQYLKSRIDEIRESVEYNKLLDVYRNGWSVMDLVENDWTLNMIKKYAGNPDLDLSINIPIDRLLKDIYERIEQKSTFPSDIRYKYTTASYLRAFLLNPMDNMNNNPFIDLISQPLSLDPDDYEQILEIPFFWPFIFYYKSKIERIEQSEDFIKELEFKQGCLRKRDLRRRGWPDCLIDYFGADFKDEDNYYEKSRIEAIENNETFQRCINQIENSWTRQELYEQGWSDFLLRHLVPKPDLCICNEEYYLISRIESIKKRNHFTDLSELRADYMTLLSWCKSGIMTLKEFIQEIVFVIPLIDKNDLIRRACESFNDYIDSKNINVAGCYGDEYYDDWYEDDSYFYDYVNPEDSESELAHICLGYLRHKQTQYDYIWKSLKEIFFVEYEDHHDELRTKVNAAIKKAYSWIH